LVLSTNCQGQYGKRKFLEEFSEFYGVLSQLPLAYPDIRRRIGEMDADLEAARLLMYQAAWMFDQEGINPKTLAALMRAKYVVGEAVARITRSALTACGAHGLFKQSAMERVFRDGASAPIMPPQSDTCLDVMGMLKLGLNPTDILPPLKIAGK